MKKILILLMAVVLMVVLIGCDKYEKSEAVYDIHEDCIEYLNEAEMLQFKSNAVFNNKWIEDNFIESYIKLEDDNDFEIYIHLQQNTDIVNQDNWFYVQALGNEFVEAKKVSDSEAGINTKFGTWFGTWLYTDKIDKVWEKKQ